MISNAARKIYDIATGAEWRNWSRVVMQQEMQDWAIELQPKRLDALEISGTSWQSFGFKTYSNTSYPEFDICDRPLVKEGFDLVVADQVFEHLLWPYRAGHHVHAMLRPGGYFLLSTPFLVRIHGAVDCTRWTETGLKYFLAECGFPLDSILTSSWGNRSCIKANLNKWVRYRRYLHSLKNVERYPYGVWALAQK